MQTFAFPSATLPAAPLGLSRAPTRLRRGFSPCSVRRSRPVSPAMAASAEVLAVRIFSSKASSMSDGGISSISENTGSKTAAKPVTLSAGREIVQAGRHGSRGLLFAAAATFHGTAALLTADFLA